MLIRFISLDFDKLMRIITITYRKRELTKKIQLDLSQVDLSEKIVL